jgi:DNA repair protein RecN (Recombination protein N)
VLNHLHIRNLAVVDEVEAELEAGMTVLTGETGAGKSILVDALSLALGSRADSDAVRPGAQRAEVVATFTPAAQSPALSWLRENDLDDGDECNLRRIVTAEGRSRGYINGNSVPMTALRELGQMLVDICGQQAHQSLMRTDNQRLLLDQHAGNEKLLTELAGTHRAWLAAQNALTEFETTRADQAARQELLSFQVKELESLAPQPGELEALDTAQRRAANSANLMSSAAEALAHLLHDEHSNARDLVSRAANLLDKVTKLEPEFGATTQILREAEIQIQEAAEALRDYLDTEDTGPEELADLESRLAAFHDIARKHRVGPEQLPELLTDLQNDLHQIENADEALEQLQTQTKQHLSQLSALCDKLSKSRAKAAKALERDVSAHMQELGMTDGRFEVKLLPLETPGAHGAERVEFAVAINPGLPAGALNKVASGGELSRVSLAIQVACSSRSDTPTMIFDEVDAGVGGGTADIVGDKLHDLASRSQVLCVTHLAQVASKGQHHFRVAKLTDGDNTRTRITALNSEERIDEIARMLGGKKITTRTREHAAEMLGPGARQSSSA